MNWKKYTVAPTNLFNPHMLDYVAKTVFHRLSGILEDRFNGFTCLSCKGHIFRAHPSYRSADPWFDYVNVKWYDDDIGQYSVPAKIQMFLDLSNNTFASGSIFKQELYVVITSCVSHPVNKDKPTNEAIAKWRRHGSSSLCKFWKLESRYRILPVSVIDTTCFVIEDYKDYGLKDKTQYVYEVKQYADWGSIHNLNR